MSNKVLIISISILYASIVGYGVYGYGVDFHGLYTNPNLNMGDFRNWMGYRLSSLSYNNINIGVYLLSFLLAISSSILIEQFLKYKLVKSKIYLAFILIITFHTWPIIMSAVNAMKQGFCNALVYLSLAMLFQKKNKLATLFMLPSIFLHKTGLFFTFVLLGMFVIKFFFLIFNQHSQRIILIILTPLLIGISFFLYDLILETDKFNRVIRGDFRIPFLIINFIFLLYFIYFYNILKENNLNLFIYLFSSISIPLLFIGFNWQYERLNMMMTLPFIFSFGLIIKSKDAAIFWILSIILLLFLTINQGIYNAITDEYTFKKIRGLL